MPRSKPSRAKSEPKERAIHHALVGGWSQRRGDFVALLLGVRQGKRRKLTYIGEVKTDPNSLPMNFLEPRLRESEIEASPFVDEPPAHSNHTHHWIAPDVVAEIEFDSWGRDRTIKNATLRAVTERPSFRRANWVVLPD
jgi:bifunctional non-homologous end joining protein LigD